MGSLLSFLLLKNESAFEQQFQDFTINTFSNGFQFGTVWSSWLVINVLHTTWTMCVRFQSRPCDNFDVSPRRKILASRARNSTVVHVYFGTGQENVSGRHGKDGWRGSHMSWQLIFLLLKCITTRWKLPPWSCTCAPTKIAVHFDPIFRCIMCITRKGTWSKNARLIISQSSASQQLNPCTLALDKSFGGASKRNNPNDW